MRDPNSLRLAPYHGAEIARILEPLARLRILVFREFPYLYQGDLAYEMDYLQTYLDTPQSLCVAVFDAQGELVGASTALPMAAEEADFQHPFLEAGFDVKEVFYFGESIVHKAWRGAGLGKRFFELREAHALASSPDACWATFCAVQRPEDHPRRPHDHAPLDPFWERRGYQKREDLTTTYEWQDLDESHPSPKPMTFWLKRLRTPDTPRTTAPRGA